MAVTTWWYAKAFLSAFNAETDYLSDDMKATLHTSSYSPNQDTHDYYDDVTNELSTANGYTAGGATLSGKANTNSANVVTFDSGNPTWTASGSGITAAIIVVRDGTPAQPEDQPLYLWSDFDGDETASGGGSFTYDVHANGWGTITADDAA